MKTIVPAAFGLVKVGSLELKQRRRRLGKKKPALCASAGFLVNS
jgi:hypothetical protein